MFKLSGPAANLGARHGLAVLEAQQYYSGGCLVGGTTVKGGMSFVRACLDLLWSAGEHFHQFGLGNFSRHGEIEGPPVPNTEIQTLDMRHQVSHFTVERGNQ